MLALIWVIAAGVSVLVPALSHGAGIYSSASTNDQIDSAIPWITLAWREVHHGSLPLWNPYSALGMPLAFNWHSMTFSVPSLIGYLFPLRLDFAAQLITTLLIAGTGVYVLGRVLRIGVLGCAFAATAFEISGPFMGFLGLPVSAVMAWAGWLFAFALLVIRDGRPRWIAAFALVLACAIYSGQPEILVQLFLALVLFVVALLWLRARRSDTGGAVARPARDLILASVAGAALGAPLALPGLQLASQSLNSEVAFRQFGGSAAPLNSLFFLGLNAPYLGFICVVLAVVGLVFVRRRPEVAALGVVAVACALMSLAPPVVAVLDHLPLLGEFEWARSTLPMALAISVLGGIGIDLLSGETGRPAISRWTAAGFTCAGMLLVVVLFFASSHLNPFDAAVRTRSFVWHAVEVGTGMLVTGGLVLLGRRGLGRKQVTRWPTRRVRPQAAGALALLVCETVFYVGAAAPLWSSSGQTALSPNAGYASIQKSVGSNLVGFGDNANCFPGSLGIVQDINVIYNIHEFSVYDPITPVAYVKAWQAATGKSPYVVQSIYCPAVTTAAEARRYGIIFVLEPPGKPGPVGGVFEGYAGYSQLYAIPGAYPAVLVPATSDGRLPGPDATGVGVSVTYPNSSSWRIVTNSTNPGVLRIHLTDVPGWHATIDGRPLELERFSGIMLQARIPAGAHTIVLHYWPTTFSIGIGLAICATVVLLLALIVGGVRLSGRSRNGRARDDPTLQVR